MGTPKPSISSAGPLERHSQKNSFTFNKISILTNKYGSFLRGIPSKYNTSYGTLFSKDNIPIVGFLNDHLRKVIKSKELVYPYYENKTILHHHDKGSPFGSDDSYTAIHCVILSLTLSRL